MLESMKKIDKKLLAMMGFIIAVILIIIVLIIVVSVSTGGKLSFEKIESKLETAAEKYFKDNENDLPKKVGQTAKVDSDELVSEGYINDLSEYTDEDVTCTAEVIVGKTVEGYDYVAALDCDEEYKTEFLADKLIAEDLGKDLYKMEDVVTPGETLGVDEDGYDLSSNELMAGYIYRGENPDNYVKIGKTTFRIVKIDGNKDLTLVSTLNKPKSAYDDRYNNEIEKNYGINDYKVSRAYEKVADYFENKEKADLIKEKIAVKNICIGARSEDETATDGSVECSVVMKDQNYGLLPLYDILNASLDENCETASNRECANYNYLMPKQTTYWTLTPSTENSYTAYKISTSSNPPILLSKTNSSSTVKFVYFLSNRVVFESGTGTENDPYIIK